jgi:phage terminase Nu1 subunit (DNA packaging protein)
MATIAEAAAHVFLSSARFQELVSQGVITKAERGAYDVNKVREEYIRHIRKNAAGHGRDAAGLSEARAELTREQTQAVALKNAIARGEFGRVATIMKGAEIIFTTFRERILAIPGKIAATCEMRSRGEVEEVLRDELYEALDELHRPILTAGDFAGDSDDLGGLGESSIGGEAAAEADAD